MQLEGSLALTRWTAARELTNRGGDADTISEKASSWGFQRVQSKLHQRPRLAWLRHIIHRKTSELFYFRGSVAKQEQQTQQQTRTTNFRNTTWESGVQPDSRYLVSQSSYTYIVDLSKNSSKNPWSNVQWLKTCWGATNHSQILYLIQNFWTYRIIGINKVFPQKPYVSTKNITSNMS